MTDESPQSDQIPSAPGNGGGTSRFPIVGLGASAGGLDPILRFFSQMPAEPGMAFVVVTHMDPQRPSSLAQLIQKKVRMRVHSLTEKMRARPNRVYVIAPGTQLSIQNGTLNPEPWSVRPAVPHPIDHFLSELGKDQARNAVGMLLSGSGSDGIQGLRVLKAEGGLVLVQDPESAEHSEMPRRAVAAGLPDFLVEPEGLAETLMQWSGFRLELTPSGTDSEPFQLVMKEIFQLLRARTGHDFSRYKKNTLIRRIERRMSVHQMADIKAYFRFLQDSDVETQVLFKELLIGVTQFFRDPEAFELLETVYLPEYLREKPEGYLIRVWVPGCSTGEEAYSIAIVLQECMESIKRHFAVQIFGTDLDEAAIRTARSGLYSERISADIHPERLKKFFTREMNSYRIKKNIRKMVIFAPQNIVQDPPFTKLDLLSCRNLLIYFSPELQKKLMPVFHYSLKPDGLLFLGSSETIGQATDLFSLVERKWKILKRKDHTLVGSKLFSLPRTAPVVPIMDKGWDGAGRPKDSSLIFLLKALLQQSGLATCVVVDELGNLVYVHGRTGRFLEPAEGEASLQILDMAKPEIKSVLASGLRQAISSRQEVAIRDVRLESEEGPITISLCVRPIPDPESGARSLILIFFEEPGQKGRLPRPTRGKGKGRNTREEVQRLEEELQYTKESLQTTIEELETSNEELKSANEELQSTNEELQSTNEELETSKEELQSLNEESSTVNIELRSRIEELSKANDDIANLLDATQIATIFLDIDLAVRRFTPKVTELIPLTPADIGRPITHFATHLRDLELAPYAEGVLRDLVMREAEVLDRNGVIFRMRVRPYRTLNNVIDGVVFTFDDLSGLKKMELSLKNAQENALLAAVTRQTQEVLFIVNRAGQIQFWSSEAERLYGYPKHQILQCDLSILGLDDKSNNGTNWLEAMKDSETVCTRQKRRTTTGQMVEVNCTMTRIRNEKGDWSHVSFWDQWPESKEGMP
ncbi:MAG: PAS domain-containing protein [Acidobacteria bacterium]|nr:PAS domain-containing protein [Acidobacteriota bacterium]